MSPKSKIVGTLKTSINMNKKNRGTPSKLKAQKIEKRIPNSLDIPTNPFKTPVQHL